MWTVTSQKQKAKQGLAVILLAGVLIGCLIFARGVQKYKYHQYQLTLDSPVKFSTPAGDFSMTVASKWPQLPAGSIPPQMLKGWSVPLPSGKSKSKSKSSAFFYIDQLDRQPEQEADFEQIINRYIPLAAVEHSSLQIEKIPNGTLSMTNLDISLLFKGRRDVQVLFVRLIFLPDGTSLALIGLGPQAEEQALSLWIEETARTLKFTPAPETPTPSPANEEPKNKTWTYLFDNRSGVARNYFLGFKTSLKIPSVFCLRTGFPALARTGRVVETLLITTLKTEDRVVISKCLKPQKKFSCPLGRLPFSRSV